MKLTKKDGLLIVSGNLDKIVSTEDMHALAHVIVSSGNTVYVDMDINKFGSFHGNSVLEERFYDCILTELLPKNKRPRDYKKAVAKLYTKYVIGKKDQLDRYYERAKGLEPGLNFKLMGLLFKIRKLYK